MFCTEGGPMSDEPAEGTITRLLHQAGSGDDTAYDKLMPLVQEELKKLAAARLRFESPGHTLQATALLDELYLKIAGLKDIEWRDRKHFFGAAANNIRRILVDHARHKRADKRPPGDRRVPLEQDFADGRDVARIDLIALDAALGQLTKLDERQSQIVEMKFFGGMTTAEIADVLEVSKRTVEGDWAMARSWLKGQLAEGP
jgi:RNA polymerase sigma factor (TIGR02999 family)